MLGRRDRLGRVYYPHRTEFLENHVDQMLAHFLEELNEKIHILVGRFGAARLAQMHAVRTLPYAGDEVTLLADWKESLQDVAGQADGLRRMLAMIFSDLESNSRFSPEIQGDAARADFRQEMAFIGAEIEEAVRQITRILFVSGEYTVSVGELQRGNMLMVLDRVRKMARELERRLPERLEPGPQARLFDR